MISCNLGGPVVPDDGSGTALIPGKEGASWFLRDISGTAENSILTYFTLYRSSLDSLELQFEQYKARNEEALSFDITLRYYFLVDISSNDNEYTANITGIKTGRYDSYTDPGDADFNTMLKDAGLENFQLNFNETNSTIQILTDAGKTYNLNPSYQYEHSVPESLEHEGEIRDGNYTEKFYYSPLGDEFRLYASYYFTYRNDTGGIVTISKSFDTYGERINNSGTFQCKITQFSNRAYPRSFYSDSYISEKYDDFINSLGFFKFTEESAVNGLTLLFDNLESEASSYTLQREPLEPR